LEAVNDHPKPTTEADQHFRGFLLGWVILASVAFCGVVILAAGIVLGDLRFLFYGLPLECAAAIMMFGGFIVFVVRSLKYV
jgi:hypothetical protein